MCKLEESRPARESTHPAAGGLGEPEGPMVHQRMLDIEVVLVVEDGDLITLLSGFRGLLSLWRDGDGGEIDLLRHCDGVLETMPLDGCPGRWFAISMLRH